MTCDGLKFIKTTISDLLLPLREVVGKVLISIGCILTKTGIIYMELMSEKSKMMYSDRASFN